MMGDYLYTLRDDAPAWLTDCWPGEEGEPMSADDITAAIRERDVAHRTPNHYAMADARPWCDRWEIVATVDHGARAADETMVYEVSLLADIIMLPVLSAMLGRDVTCDIDPWTAACEEIAPYDGGWCEPTDDDPGAERATRLHGSVVWYRSYDQCPDVMVEASGDVGMTWFAVRVADGAR